MAGAALGAFAAGPYTALVTTPGQSAAAGGLLQDGWVLEWTLLEQVLDKSDAYGRTQIESFHQGLNAAISAIFHEWKALELRLLTPQANMLPILATRMDVGQVGMQGSDQASAMVLTAVAGTPAALVGPATVTISKVRQVGETPIQALLGPEKRTTAFRGRILPYYSASYTGGLAFWSAT